MRSTHEPGQHVRSPAVAGSFYPDQPSQLRLMVLDLLKARPTSLPTPPKALIAPHAGYQYSGPIAASAFVTLPTNTRRLVLLGPSHHVAFQGLMLPAATAFATPLGPVPVDEPARQQLASLAQVQTDDRAHRSEHCLEVMLPFLQLLLTDFTIVPLVVGQATDQEVGTVIERLWLEPETRVIVSSDLSHYCDYDQARALDQATARAIEALRPEDLGHDQACGRIPVRGLLWSARRAGLRVTTLDLRNSGDTAGPRHQVVGYGAFAFT